jgi:hypothetical protein
LGLIGVRVKVRVWVRVVVTVRVRVRVRARIRVGVRVRVRGVYKGCSVSMRVASAALASKGIYWGENKSKRKEETRREVCG